MKKTYISASIITLVIALVFITSGKQAPNNNTITIGFAGALTGFASEWGEGELRGVELAIDEYNSRGGSIELVIEDIASDEVQALNAIRKLIEVDEVSAILGITWADAFQGVFPLVERAHIPLIGMSTTMEAIENSDQYEYLFSTWWPQQDEVARLYDYIEETSAQGSLVVVHDPDSFNTTLSKLFINEARMRGFPEVKEVVVPLGSNDFRTSLLEIQKHNPSGIFVVLQDVSLLGPFMKQARELGLGATIFSTASTQNESLLENFSAYVEGVVYTYPALSEDEKYKEVLGAYEDRYGNIPLTPSFVNAYNASLMLFEALENGARTGEEIQHELKNISIKGVGIDTLSFNEKGQIDGTQFSIKTIRSGEFITLREKLLP